MPETQYINLKEFNYPNIILGSQSPRRKHLLEMAEVSFEIHVADVDESIPLGINSEFVPEFLARKKADAISHLFPDAVVITADTIVLLDELILGKPKDRNDAFRILSLLSGNKHKVITGVCIRCGDKEKCFSCTTEVHFRVLTEDQINFYISKYKPYDKAGAYAIQEWIGVLGIEKINGDYYNVMGLPVGKVIIELNNFLEKV